VETGSQVACHFPETGPLGTERLGTERVGTERVGTERLGSQRVGAEFPATTTADAEQEVTQ
jgi:hypothetical protein